MKTTVLEGQSIFDIALMLTGSTENAFDIALQNNINITDTLFAGQELKYNGQVVNRSIVDYYRINEILPATAYKDAAIKKIFDKTFDKTFE
jgi:hypothetical protein